MIPDDCPISELAKRVQIVIECTQEIFAVFFCGDSDSQCHSASVPSRGPAVCLCRCRFGPPKKHDSAGHTLAAQTGQCSNTCSLLLLHTIDLLDRHNGIFSSFMNFVRSGQHWVMITHRSCSTHRLYPCTVAQRPLRIIFAYSPKSGQRVPYIEFANLTSQKSSQKPRRDFAGQQRKATLLKCDMVPPVMHIAIAHAATTQCLICNTPTHPAPPGPPICSSLSEMSLL